MSDPSAHIHKDIGDFFAEQRKDLGYRAEYRLAEIGEDLAEQIVRFRTLAGMSQSQLAKAMSTQQSRVSEWEDPDYARYTLLTLAKLADVLKCTLRVTLGPACAVAKFVEPTTTYAGSIIPAENRVGESNPTSPQAPKIAA
jgi:transcriptional regulator with XRE-family HTH domain